MLVGDYRDSITLNINHCDIHTKEADSFIFPLTFYMDFFSNISSLQMPELFLLQTSSVLLKISQMCF